jgi:hypothetical protein
MLLALSLGLIEERFNLIAAPLLFAQYKGNS